MTTQIPRSKKAGFLKIKGPATILKPAFT